MPCRRANASTRAIACEISPTSSSRQGVRAWFERPRSSPGVPRRIHPPSTRSVIVAGHASTAWASSRQTSSGGELGGEATELGAVADRVVPVAVVHQEVSRAGLGGVLGDRRGQLRELFF